MDAFTPSLNAYRCYDDDGGEAASTPLAAQDTNPTIENASNVIFHLRCRVDEVGSGSVGGASTDDWGLEYRVNGAGAWNAVGASSSVVRSAGGASMLSDGSATTNRGTDGISDPGSGSFDAGEQEDGNAVIEDVQLNADNFTELLWALELVAADNSNGDFIEFRITLNGSNIAGDVSPRVDVSKAVNTDMNAEPGAYSVSGAGDAHAIAENNAPGSYAVTGSGDAHGLEQNAEAGAVAVTGADDAHGVEESAAPGSYLVSGIDADTQRDVPMNAEPGSVVVSGSDDAHGIESSDDPGSYDVTGTAADTQRDVPMNAEPGSIAVAGADDAHGIEQSADPGAVVVSGADDAHAIAEDAEPGSLAVTGFDADTSVQMGGTNTEMNAEPGSYSVAGADDSGDIGQNAEAGAVVVTGADDAHGLEESADPGVYLVSGVDADTQRDVPMNAEPGSIAITGVADQHHYTMNAEPGAYAVTGVAATTEVGITAIDYPFTFDSTGGELVNPSLLHNEILNEGGITTTLRGINVTEDGFTVTFAGTLSAAEETTLHAVLARHARDIKPRRAEESAFFGRLQVDSTTALSLRRYRGDACHVNGEDVEPGPDGIVLNTTDDLIDASGDDTGGSMAASTLYYLYLANSKPRGAPVLRASAQAPTFVNGIRYLGVTAPALHWRFVGWVYANGSTQFQDSETSRHLANLYNRVWKRLYTAPGYGDDNATDSWTNSTSTWTAANGGSGHQLSFIATGEDCIQLKAVTACQHSAANGQIGVGVGRDGGDPLTQGLWEDPSGGIVNTIEASDEWDAAEGRHTAEMLVYAGSATATHFADLGRHGAAADVAGTYLIGKVRL